VFLLELGGAGCVAAWGVLLLLGGEMTLTPALHLVFRTELAALGAGVLFA